MLRLIPLCLAGLIFADSAWALRCGRSLVVEGDSQYQVYRRCGEPDLKENRVVYRELRWRGSGYDQPGLETRQTQPVLIEQWTYDFGSNRFVEVVTFEDGRVISIQPGGYGE